MKHGDGSIYLRGSTYWISYWHRGIQHRESAHTAKEGAARKLLRERLTDLGRGRTAAITADKVTFSELAQALIDDYRVNGQRTEAAAGAIAHLRECFGDDMAADIRTPRIRAYIAQRQKDGAENATVNRELSALRRAFNLMIKDGVLEAAPYVPMLAEHNTRQGFLEPAAFERLLVCFPGYLRDPVEFLYRSGWRVGEMRSLEWRDIDLTAREIRLRPENSKNKRGRVVPLVGRLLAVIDRAREKRRLDCPFVFHIAGQPIGDFRKAWRNAIKAAGFGKLLIHDLRRSAVRNMVRAGISENVAMQVSGHKTRSVFSRYDITSTADIERGLDRLDAYIDVAVEAPAKVTLIKSA
ncbi:MAG: tyrosine-type recombinase/integrase [Candidatus Binataceae bacterium]